jgi:hypothetical protein
MVVHNVEILARKLECRSVLKYKDYQSSTSLVFKILTYVFRLFVPAVNRLCSTFKDSKYTV